jgi:hypothetical protein
MMLKQYLRYGRKKLKKVKIYTDEVFPIRTEYKMSKGNIAGVMIAFEIPIYDTTPNVVGVGFTKWNRKKDEYDYNFMIKLAKERAITWSIEDREIYIPPSIKWDIYWFIKRCQTYYKDKELPHWATTFVDMLDTREEYFLGYIPKKNEKYFKMI